ncbi:riboflavin synthase [Waterburya agarophytonicola K14]|uniref:Riboflavin synthase n=1 Tax=Waterburya agarophytonicola KI4 TaxID=2874699 RepID=A0A964FHJ9_9CYAN|nr:riboflavin synthase [Waterburya agarophytonicola]MCC0177568.1 riboflavin synthase [Waterburya agarophytonicola KI4]
MFTGLIQCLGLIDSYNQDAFEISIMGDRAKAILADLAIGDSVAVDGVCLTVETILARGFIATTSPETLARTSLGDRDRAAKYVNLETSLRMGSKIGGHFVTGHIDGIGCLIEAISTATSWEIRFGTPAGMSEQWQDRIGRYLVSKGSIAVNGISLTIAECAADSSWFTAAVIPHTYSSTNLSCLQAGNLVNLESDILGKYVDRLVSHRLPTSSAPEDISLSFLAEHGY